MKKISNPLLAALLIAEVIAAISLVNQLEKYSLLWTGIGGLIVMAGVTAYFFAKGIADYYMKQEQARNVQLDHYKNEFMEFKDDYLKIYMALKDSINELAKNNAEFVEKFSETSTKAYLKLTEDMNATTIEQFTMLANSFAEQSERICAKTDKNVESLGLTVHNEMNGVLSSIKILLDKFSEQVDSTKTLIEHVIFDVKDELDNQIKTSEAGISNMQNSISGIFNDGMKDMNSLLTSIQTVFDRKLLDIHVEYEKMLMDVKSELVRHTEEVRGSVSENTRILSENLNVYSQDISANLQHIWNDNIDAMETFSEAFLTKTSEMLEQQNSELMIKYMDYSHDRIKEISDKYDQIMDTHITSLKNEIQKYILEFTKVNHTAFKQNAENVEKLVGTEEELIEELTSKNEHLNSIIIEGFNQFRDAVIEMFHELEGKMAQNIADNANVSKEHISCISEHNKAAINELAENLQRYSDSFVDKSAEAIANVQRDNSLKLQEMCESYADFSRDSRMFAEKCNENNLQTNDSIQHLIEQNNDFLTSLQQVSNNSVKEINKVLDEYVDNMSQRVETLNIDSSKRYNEAMEDYRDSFIKLNADALANVQKDNVNAISDVYSKLAELANNIQRTDKQMKDLAEVLVSILDEMKKAIKDGNQTASENQEEFNGDLKTSIEKMKNIFVEKSEEYNIMFDKLDKIISSVLNEVRKNTENYNNTLKSITDSQKAMNSLTSKDIKLLEKLVGR